jgi:hypothetical protein
VEDVWEIRQPFIYPRGERKATRERAVPLVWVLPPLLPALCLKVEAKCCPAASRGNQFCAADLTSGEQNDA